MMFCWCALGLLTLVPVVTGNNAGVKVKITQQGIDYAAITTFNYIMKNIPDLKKEVLWIKIIQLTGLQIQNPETIKLVHTIISETGVSIKIQSTNLHMSGHVKMKPMQNRTFDLNLTSLSFEAIVAVETDIKGHTALSINDCKTEFGQFKIHIAEPNSFFNTIISYLENNGHKWVCPFLEKAIVDFNKQLSTLSAKIKDVEIDYSVNSAVISDTGIELELKGVFYKTQRKESHFSPTPFPLASSNNKMLCIAISAFTINSWFLASHDAGTFNIVITDDKIPSNIPIRLSTTTFGAFIPQISRRYPDLKVQLVVKTVEGPAIKLESKRVILELLCTVTAYAVKSDNTRSQLFVLNLEGSASGEVSVTKDNLVLAFTLEKIKASIKETNVENFEVTKLNTFLTMVIKDVAFPIINANLVNGIPLAGYPLSSFLGNVHLENTQVEVLKDYMLIETDVQIEENASS